MKTETGKPFEFVNHRFMIDYLADNHPHKATIKASQVGWTTAELFDDIHLVGKRNMAVIHTMHNNDFLQTFVRPRVNPLISGNPAIAKMQTSDSEGLKGFGKNFLYFKGANAESQAISTPADVLKFDELDKSDPITIELFGSRLSASEYRYVREFSNPTSINYGIDSSWKQSNQLHWFVKCPHCNHDWFIDFEPSDSKNHYVHKELRIFACGKCERELTNRDRIRGRWVARFPSRDKIHGYWVSQMMVPWFTAEMILDEYEKRSPTYFNSMVLGKAYTPSDLSVNREAILRACVPSHIPQVGVAMGVDQKAAEFHWVAMTAQGVFAHGKEKSWEDIESLKLKWNAIVVADGRPYPTGPKRLAQKYPDFYVGLGKPITTLDTVIWDKKTNTVYYDRVKILDIVADEITNAKLLFRENAYQLEDYIADWENIYRTTVEEPDGRVKSDWLKKANKESDYSFATAYARIALSRILGSTGSGTLLESQTVVGKTTDTMGMDGSLQSTLGSMVDSTLSQFDE
jgi:hypothetical protein